jgi:hypothetical protein
LVAGEGVAPDVTPPAVTVVVDTVVEVVVAVMVAVTVAVTVTVLDIFQELPESSTLSQRAEQDFEEKEARLNTQPRRQRDVK